jgi:hypothetical protein
MKEVFGNKFGQRLQVEFEKRYGIELNGIDFTDIPNAYQYQLGLGLHSEYIVVYEKDFQDYFNDDTRIRDLIEKLSDRPEFITVLNALRNP